MISLAFALIPRKKVDLVKIPKDLQCVIDP